MDAETVKNKLMSFFLRNYSYIADEIEEDESLIEKGYIDSLGIIGLILYIEHNFNIKVKDSEIVPENFDSIINIIAYINKKADYSAGNGR